MRGQIMINGHFYYLTDQYFIDFKDPFIQKNHENVNGVLHERPCFCAVEGQVGGIFWLIPISSKTEKYRKVANQKISKYHRCDTIKFGDVLGYERAFLIQNMIPVTEEYIKCEYRNNNTPVAVSGSLERELRKAANFVLNKQRRGAKLIFPDVLTIESKLAENIKNGII